MSLPKVAFILMLVQALLFSDSGYMRAIVEKDWTITTNSTSVSSIILDGFFLVNNSNQRVLSLETNAEPQLEGELIKISYSNQNPGKRNLVYARAVVEISYSPQFQSDPKVPFSPLVAYGASNFTPEIKDQAYSLASSSTLSTTSALTDWVHDNVRYNINYFGRSVPASVVFVNREGVCTEYAHLLLAMLNSLGMNSRFVSGYVLQNDSFQPHAWVEVFSDNETISADPTFGEAGAISANHIAMFYSNEFLSASKIDLFYGENRSEAFDLVNAKGGKDFDLSVNVSITPIEVRDYPKTAETAYSFENSTGNLGISVQNPLFKYLLLDYSFNSPAEAYGQDMRTLVLGPEKTDVFRYKLNSSGMKPDFIYTIPFVVGVPGSTLTESVTYAPKSPDAIPACSLGALLLAIPAFAALAFRSRKN